MRIHKLFLIAIYPAIILAQPGPGGPGGGQSGDGIWRRNAAFGESQTFDYCLGHQPGTGQYHYHIQPACLRAQLGDNIVQVKTSRIGATYQEKTTGWKHSPILGWAADGYPIYGPYGYSDPTNPSSSVKRIASGFRLRNITKRTSLPDWALPNHTGISQQLATNQYGPDVSALYPLGRYLEDYEYVQGLGDLDQYNGRMTVTPEYPQGTYAYYTTLDSNGAPAFPYILAGQYYGAASGGNAQNVPGTVTDYFNNSVYTQTPQSTPLLASWATSNSTKFANIVSGFDPAAGPLTTWAGVASPTYAEIQRIRYSPTAVYVNANGFPGYTAGPWFGFTTNGGVFPNFPTPQNYQFQFPATPVAATTHGATTGGPCGLWVNGVAVFNFIDGASYSNAQAADQGGGIVVPGIIQVSAASFEGGPVTAGSIIAAFPIFGGLIASSTAAASSAAWPTTLGGATVTVTDSASTSRTAQIAYASPAQLNYVVPDGTANGIASVKVTVGGNSVTGSINVVSTYPNLFNGAYTVGDPAYLILVGSGLGAATTATATIGGINAQVSFAGAQGTYKGLDQYNILIPQSLAGKGTVDVVVTAGGRISNTVNITLQ